MRPELTSLRLQITLYIYVRVPIFLLNPLRIIAIIFWVPRRPIRKRKRQPMGHSIDSSL
jgi:hypothetical protein